MDLPLDEEISQTYAQILLSEQNKMASPTQVEPASPTSSSFIALFKVELLLAATSASDVIMDSEGT